jgi:putative peptide zinc metalloprotease protein
MARFEPDARVAVRPFARHHEGDDVTVGLLDQQVFVTIPAEGVEILDALAAGATVGEAARAYAEAHGEPADIVDFLEALADAGFVASPSGGNPLLATGTPEATAGPEFRWISRALARRIVGAPTAFVCAIAIAAGMALFATDPSLVPGATVLVFHRNLAAWLAVVFAINTAGVIVHELAHVLAARAAGVPARVRISHRLWFIVAETDMTGIWLAPPHSRQRAFLAGPIVDAVCASALLGLRWGQHIGVLALSPTLQLFVAATLMTYLLRLLWQCFVFVRTDFYYVLATALRCKNLLADTEGLLHNWAARALGRAPAVDQSAIPPRERRAIRAYAAVWLGGRVIALYSLAFAALPVLAGYGTEIVRTVAGDHPSYSLADLVTVALLVFGMQAAGLVLWIRSLYLSRTKGASHDVAV